MNVTSTSASDIRKAAKSQAQTPVAPVTPVAVVETKGAAKPESTQTVAAVAAVVLTSQAPKLADSTLGQLISALASQAGGNKADPQPDHGNDDKHGHASPPPPVSPPPPPASPPPPVSPPPPPPVSPPPPPPVSPPPISPPPPVSPPPPPPPPVVVQPPPSPPVVVVQPAPSPPAPAPAITPAMRETPVFFSFVREQLHNEPVSKYSSLPFSKRSENVRVTRAAAETETRRVNTLQMTAMKTMVRAEAAMPLLQMTQMSAYRFQTFSASAYRPRYALFG